MSKEMISRETACKEKEIKKETAAKMKMISSNKETKRRNAFG